MDLLLACQYCILALLAVLFLGRSCRPNRPGGSTADQVIPKLPPEPAGAWPVVGHLPLLGAGKEMAARTLGHIADKCGPVFMLRLGVHLISHVPAGGYHVPAGTRLLTNLWKLHRDPRVWGPDPEEFRPERFLAGGEAAGLDVRGQQFEYLPFGSGRRICPGINFALQVMQLTVARLVHGFEMGTPDGGAVDMVEGLGLNITKATPLEVHISPRLPPQLYHRDQ